MREPGKSGIGKQESWSHAIGRKSNIEMMFDIRKKKGARAKGEPRQRGNELRRAKHHKIVAGETHKEEEQMKKKTNSKHQ